MNVSDWPFEVRPLSDALGAEIVGITLKEAVTPTVFPSIYEVFLEYQLLLFQDVDLPPGLQVKLASNFGEVQVHVMDQYHGFENHPEIYLLSNLDIHGNPNGKHPDVGTLFWHTDGSWRKQRGLATLMYSEIVPSKGGETHFSNMYRAYDCLDPKLKTELKNRCAIHNLDFSRTRHMKDDVLTEEQKACVPPVPHPIFRVHPETGNTCLFLGDHAESIVGMDYDEGRALIDSLNQSANQDKLVYKHHWKPNQVLVWDNRCLLHRATSFDTANQKRVMRRCTTLEAP